MPGGVGRLALRIPTRERRHAVHGLDNHLELLLDIPIRLDLNRGYLVVVAGKTDPGAQVTGVELDPGIAEVVRWIGADGSEALLQDLRKAC